jgi:hypothetical protein
LEISGCDTLFIRVSIGQPQGRRLWHPLAMRKKVTPAMRKKGPHLAGEGNRSGGAPPHASAPPILTRAVGCRSAQPRAPIWALATDADGEEKWVASRRRRRTAKRDLRAHLLHPSARGPLVAAPLASCAHLRTARRHWLPFHPTTSGSDL